MARINLLPWREERREERQKQFYIALGLTSAFAILILYIVISYANDLIEQQTQRNQFLQQAIAKVDLEIQKIQALEKTREKLLARMEVIQELQQSRPKIVKIFDSLPRIIPDGVNISTLIRTGDRLSFDGVAQSNARVSVFMRQIDESPEYGESTLNVIKRTSTRNEAIRTFTLEVRETALVVEKREQ